MFMNIMFYVSLCVLQQLGDIFIKLTTHCKIIYKYSIHIALCNASEVKINFHGQTKPYS